MKINQVVVTYLSDDLVSRPPAPPIVSPCKGIMSCFAFLFLGVPRHYARRSYNCWCKACSRVRGRVAEIVARELQKAKPGKWGCVQAHELWSPKEETHSWTLLAAEVWDGCWKHELRREGVHIGPP
jgi:hypothetical protein